MFRFKHIFICFVLLVLGACGGPEMPDDVAREYQKLGTDVDFNRHVKPILSDKCFICHGPDKAKVKAELQLHLPELAFAELKNTPGKYAIKPGNPNKSESVKRILSSDPETIMPKPDSHLSLTNYEKAVLIKWIVEGAEYKDHWAFISPLKPKIPAVDGAFKVNNAIDNFIQSRLVQENLEPSSPADRATLLRRVSFDLTGLPPTPEEINDFINDNSQSAFEKQVDRLLASPHFGEQMTLDWMDLSRYADTHGYTVDRYRDVSPWRDWVISSFNNNMPYDEFIRWQLAGDMMPNASKEQILATTFNRLHPQNGEGGIIDEEFRSEYASDRTNTVSEGLMGLTVACAKCHDHKYDPISQKNYYEMYSFFNNVNESGQISFDYSMPAPTLLLPTKEQEEFLKYINELIADKEEELEKTVKKQVADSDSWINRMAYREIKPARLPSGAVAKYDFNQRHLVNQLNPLQQGQIKRQYAIEQKPNFTAGFEGNGLLMDGDAWLHLNQVGSFQRHQSFSIGIRLFIPEPLESGVVFHKGVGAKLYNFRGYHLALKENKIELVLAHLHPANAIVEFTKKEVPKEEWVQLTMTYDGSSAASGLKVFLNGAEMETTIVVDDLYKDIAFNKDAYGVLDVPKDPGLQIGARWRGKGIGGAVVDDIVVFDRELTPLEVLQLGNADDQKKILSKQAGKLTSKDKDLLSTYYLANNSPEYKKAKQSLEEIKKAMVDSMDRVQEIMVMKEMPEPRETFVLERGQYDVYGERVYPGTPESIFEFADSLPKNRLGFAQWITAKDHPLTARVTVNRYWQNIFGTGIVKTAEDFGNQGELPSHPELLDWLAVQFVASGWDVKKLIKLMVMSATYQQSSKGNEKARRIDQENRLLARGPSMRLTGEMLRDNVLAASGLLHPTIGGKSVNPYQPEGLWKINGASYKEDSGEKLYRRSMYTIWKRSVPHPTIATFDAPDRSYCTVRRQNTNTPLQALVLLNDPIYIESARVLGNEILEHENIQEGISEIFERLTGRKIKEAELTLLLSLQEEEYQKFKNHPAKTRGWLNTGEFKINSDDTALLAANAIVASTIINSDATITKR